jgi:predicted nucleotidyltransferase
MNAVELCESLFRSEYAPVLEIFRDAQACVFGGFLRDFVSGDSPNDIDVVVREICQETLHADLIELGYHLEADQDDELEYAKQDCLPIHIIIDDDAPIDPFVRLGPCPIPDYDVNLLALDASGIFNWMDLSDPDVIIAKILKREASAINPEPDRIEKFATKRFKIADEKYASTHVMTSFACVDRELKRLEYQNKLLKARRRQFQNEQQQTKDYIAKTKSQTETNDASLAGKKRKL